MKYQGARKTGSIVLWCAASLLAACGGGGGGGGGGDAAPAAAARETPLALTSTNMGDAATLALGYGEATLIFGQLAHEWVAALAASGGSAVNAACDGGGTSTLALTDRDGNKRPTAGDQVVITLVNCYLRTFDDTLDGTLTVDLTTPVGVDVQEAGVLSFGSNVVLPDATAALHFEGALRYEYGSDRLGSTLRALSATSPFAVSVSAGGLSKRDVLTGIVAQKTVRRDLARTANTLQLRVASDLIGGSLQVATTTPLGAWFSTVPDAGLLTVGGANGAVLNVQAVAANSNSLALTLGNASSRLAISDAGTGLLWWGAGVTAQGTGSRGYTTETVFDNGFKALAGPAAALSQNPGVLTWQYSRPLDPSTLPSTAVLSQYLVSTGYFWGPHSVPVDVRVDGALLSWTPHGPLQPRARYLLATFLPIRLQGASGSLSAPAFDATVPDTIGALASVATPGALLGHGVQLALDGNRSTASGTAVASARWTQVSGPSLAINGAGTLAPTVAISPGENTSGSAVLELEVRNAAGEFDRDRVTVLVLNDLAPSRAIRYRAFGTGLASWAVDDADATPYARFFAHSNAVDVIVGIERLRVLVNKPSAWSAGQVQALGPGSGASVVLPFQAVGVNCTVQSGSMTVADYAVGADSNLTRLALDIVAACGDGTPVNVSVRVNSALPVPF